MDGHFTVPLDADEWKLVTTSSSRDVEKLMQCDAPSSSVSVFNSGKQAEGDTAIILATARVRLQTGV